MTAAEEEDEEGEEGENEDEEGGNSQAILTYNNLHNANTLPPVNSIL